MTEPRKDQAETPEYAMASAPIAATALPKEITYHHVETPGFRSVPADGALGGFNSNRMVHLIFFNERTAIPTEVVASVTPEGHAGAEILDKRKVIEGIVRHLEVEVVIPFNAAQQLHSFLGSMLKQIQVSEPNKNTAHAK